ncbi:MAG: PAS domain-containing protein [Nitrospira sp.]|nr:PAS domain-containing protein [Nitrospira sp.]
MSPFKAALSSTHSQPQQLWSPVGEDATLLMESVPESIFFVDHDSRIVSLNSSAQQLVGRTRPVVGQSFHDLIGCLMAGESEVAQCPLNRMVTTGELVVIPSHFGNGKTERNLSCHCHSGRERNKVIESVAWWWCMI